MMHLPVVTVVKPAILSGLSNGRLPSSVLVTWTPPWSGIAVTMVAPAMRAYKALTITAYRVGFVLKSVGSYRTYQRQVELFDERYRRVSFETGIWWDGSFWVHESGAQAAIPGTSNHGLGLADDVGEERDGDPAAESISQAAVDWLVTNERRFGFSHEVQSEPWHIRYWAGDNIPAAVIAFEQGDDMSEQAERDIKFLAGRVDAIAHLRPTVVYGEETGTALPVVAVLNAIAAKVGIDADELEAITAAAREGAAAGVIAAADELAAAVLAALPERDLTKADVEQALRSVLLAGVADPQ